MSSTSSSSQTFSSSSVQNSSELIDLTSCSTTNTNPTSFAPLHRTVELENLHDYIKNDEKQITPTKKTLTKCMTVIGDGSDKQI
ncbi:unnamed protein product [Rotaria sordida]|uniref:Uncharacterized protein n=1 Tax=Rotaria sordida TaxID=392033 RepID=A0A819PVZ1_9BILA|nr:unnamed protein product [Rotaria sordida]CAF0933954.1 unnamed protein product [Rotaria sordida]CAF1210396.1 unnamed protein product [Rotaria sordida]CAF3951253.1 unnamed protein product [Rotaria sordida]CAF4021151.1 unnamed protein product [Rotaria sordida]